MKDLVLETEQLAEAYSVKFKDCGNGHIQLSAHGNLMNYYPLSKRRSIYSPTLNRQETDCSPWDAVRLCLSEAKLGMKPKKPKKNRADFDLTPLATNPAGLKHFYKGKIMPWDDSLGNFEMGSESDVIRIEAYQLEENAVILRVKADEMDAGIN